MADSPPTSRARYAAAGMLLSKVSGLVRERILGNLFGVSAYADVWRLALRAPNNLQNLLGEQTLSAAFIPIYARLLEEGKEREAGRFAGAILGLLLATVCALVLIFVALAPWVVAILTPGLLKDAEEVAAGLRQVDRYPLVVQAVRITFPMAGILVFSAWALAVLNGHRRFFLSYLSPIFWNGAIVSALLVAAWRGGHLWSPDAAGTDIVESWVFVGLIGALVGGLLQFIVQMPLVLRLCPQLRPSFDVKAPGVGKALKAVVPAIAGRGVVQLGFYIDMFLSSFLRAGAPGALGYCAALLNLVLGVFGMSVAAAELPEMSREDVEADPEAAHTRIAERLERAIGQSLFIVMPAVLGYLAFGFLVCALLFRGGRFGVAENWLIYLLLTTYTLGLPASAVSRITQNAYFALRDTKTPAYIATARLVLGSSTAAMLMLWLDQYGVGTVVDLPDRANKNLYLGALGLGLGASLGAWFEFVLLTRGLRQRIPTFQLPWRRAGGHLVRALLTALPPLGLWYWLDGQPGLGQSVFVQALLVLPAYVVAYLGIAWLRRAPELRQWIGR